MRVGLIGHSGFLGQAFLEILSAENEVICYQKGDYLEVLDKCDVYPLSIINVSSLSKIASFLVKRILFHKMR